MSRKGKDPIQAHSMRTRGCFYGMNSRSDLGFEDIEGLLRVAPNLNLYDVHRQIVKVLYERPRWEVLKRVSRRPIIKVGIGLPLVMLL